MTPTPRRAATLAVSAFAVTMLAACGAPDLAWACATDAPQPIVYDENLCSADRDGRTGLGESGLILRWYSAPRSDIGPDDVPVVGQPLDGDFYDPADRADTDGGAGLGRRTTTSPRKANPAPATTKVKASTPPRTKR